MLIELSHHDVRTLHQSHFCSRIDAGARGEHIFNPRAAGIDQRAGVDGAPLAAHRVFDRDFPDSIDMPDLDRAGTGVDLRAAIGGIARGKHHEAGVVDKAVGIFKTFCVAVGN